MGIWVVFEVALWLYVGVGVGFVVEIIGCQCWVHRMAVSGITGS